MSTNITPPPDKRGKHFTRPNMIPENIIQQLNDHIRSFPKRESHYGRGKSAKFYLSPELNIKIMHQLYLKKYENHCYELLQRGERNKPLITYDFYFRYFKENFNYSFGRSRTDTCKKCDLLDNKFKSTLDKQERNAIKAEKDVHLKKSEWFYKELKQRTEEAEKYKEIEVLCFDFQQNLPLPKVPSTDAFYLRQLWMYNFCIHSAKNKSSHFYMYDETTAKKGANEVISFLHHYITNKLSPGVKKLYLFSDNCCAQNKNNVMVRYLAGLCKIQKFESIIHRFPEPGHSFLPCDRSFGIIEKKKRLVERIYLPQEYHKLVEKASLKFKVITVTQNMIYDFCSLVKEFSLQVPKNPNKEKFAVSTYRVFLYSELSDEIQCSKTACGSLLFQKFTLLNFKKSVQFTEKNTCYNALLPIKDAKFKNVMQLATEYVPKSDLAFYYNLKSTNDPLENNNNSGTDGDEDTFSE